jgi:hypothetical protein
MVAYALLIRVRQCCCHQTRQSDWPMYQQSAILKLLNSSRVGETRQLAAKGVVCICFSRLRDASASAAVYNKSVLLHCALNSRTFDQLNRSSAPHEVLRTVIWYLPLLPAPSTAFGLTFNGFLPLPCGYPSCIDRLRSKTVMNPVGIHFQCLPVEKERKTRQSLKRLKRAPT